MTNNVEKKEKAFYFNKKFRTVFQILILLFSGLVLVYACMGLILIHQINSQLGFSYATPYDEKGDEIFLITHVDFGNKMHKTGLREGDKILYQSVNTLYCKLISNQGSNVSVPIQRDNMRMDISIDVPKLDLFFSPGFLCWDEKNE